MSRTITILSIAAFTVFSVLASLISLESAILPLISVGVAGILNFKK